MKHNPTLLLSVILCLAAFHNVSADETRVNCDSLTMTVPSANAKCYQTTSSTIIVQETAVVSDTAPLDTITETSDALDPKLESAQVAALALHITDYEASGKLAPEVTVYTFEELSKVDLRLFNIAASLTDKLNNISAEYTTLDEAAPTLPFLPYQAKTRVLNVLPALITFNGGTGIRTITAFGNQGDSVSNNNLLYTMQAVTQDGERYISAVIPISCSELEGKDPASLDWNSLSESSWNPSLTTLDHLMQSIVIQ